MDSPKKSRKYATAANTPRSSTAGSPTFTRTQRTTHCQKSIRSLRQEIKSQLEAVASRSPNKNFISEKSEIFLRMDNQLEEQIKRKITLQKLQSKMSIISMQTTKFKISRNKSMALGKMMQNATKVNIHHSPQFYQTIVNKFENTESRREANRYQMNCEVEAFRSYLRIISLNHPKGKNERKTQILSRYLLEYFIGADESEVRKDLQEIKSISLQLVNGLAKSSCQIHLNLLRMVDRDISKLVFNICYELYLKKQKGIKLGELININKDIEYTARRLKFYDLALKTCFDLGKLYCDDMEYEKAFQEYTNAIKLAIFLDNKYDQEIAIDKLGICKYYLGDSVSALYFHNNIHHLSNYDLHRIKAEYSNDNEIKRLIEEKREFKKINVKDNPVARQRISRISRMSKLSKIDLSLLDKENLNLPMCQSFDEKVDIGEFTFVKDNRNQFYPLQNNNEMKNNLKRIIKIPSLRDKIHILKKSLIKNDQIGIKKYCGEGYVVPVASIFCKKQNSVERNEVCLSHRSYNRNDLDQQMNEIDQESKIIISTLNYFINENIINQQEVVVKEVTGESDSENSSKFLE